MPEARLRIHTRAEIVWRLLIDTTAWPNWGPSVRAVDCPTRLVGPGVSGRVQTAVGVWLPFSIAEWVPGRFWSWKVAGVSATGHTVIATDRNSCDAIFTVPRWAPFYLPVCRRALHRLAILAAEQSPEQGHGLG